MSSSIKELSDRPDLWALGVHLSALQKELKLFTLEQVNQVVQVLASRMQTELPSEVLRTMRIVPIPRGGLLVAGRLAYALGLSHDQFFDDGRSPICLVDDCALTGKRFGQMLRRFDGRDVWFCHLVSTVELRQAILEKEPTVKGCIAAGDLAIRQNNVAEQMTGEGRYLNMSVEPVAFPWTEPGLPVTLPFSVEVEDGWRLLPPHLVSGNLAMLNLPAQPGGDLSDIQASSQVVWKLANDRLLLYEESTQLLFETTGLATEIWKGCAGYQSTQLMADWLLSCGEVRSKQEIEPIIAELVAKKILIQL